MENPCRAYPTTTTLIRHVTSLSRSMSDRGDPGEKSLAISNFKMVDLRTVFIPNIPVLSLNKMKYFTAKQSSWIKRA